MLNVKNRVRLLENAKLLGTTRIVKPEAVEFNMLSRKYTVMKYQLNWDKHYNKQRNNDNNNDKNSNIDNNNRNNNNYNDNNKNTKLM